MKTARAAAVIFLLFAFAAAAGAQAPRIDKVDPPSWFTDLSLKSVMLLVQGENLGGCAVSLEPAGGTTAKVLGGSANGHYLFVELTLPAQPKSGECSLLVKKGPLSAKVPFLLQPSCKGKHPPAGFSPKDAIYLVMPDRFVNGDPTNDVQPSNRDESKRSDPRGWHGGDFAGVSQRLEYLKDVGLTAVWLTPICENAGPISYHGYHATDFYRADPHFGTMAEFVAMVDKAHALGLKVIQDQVANHTGPAHVWAQDPPTSTWFNGTPEKHLNCDWNIPGLSSPHATPNTQDPTVRGWFAGILPDLNGDDPLLVRYLAQNSIWWVALTGIDGIRLDTYPYMTYEFWKQWFPPLRREFPGLCVVGEVMEWTPATIAYWQKGFHKIDGTAEGPESVMDFVTLRALSSVYGPDGTWKTLRDIYAQDYVYPAPQMVFSIMDNHDTVRFASALGTQGPAFRNAQALNLLLRGIPQIYSGGELGLEGAADPDNRRDFPGGFPGDKANAFTGEGLKAEERANLAWTRAVLNARRSCDALQSGTYREIFADQDVLLVEKSSEHAKALLLFHRGAKARDFAWNVGAFPALKGVWKDALHEGETLAIGDEIRCPLAPFDVKIWIRR